MTVEQTSMAVRPTAIDGLHVIEPKTVTDDRGTVREFFRTSGFAEAGLTVPPRWAQVTMTWTRHGGVRGLHGEAMTKLVGVVAGSAFGAYLDTRTGSPTRGEVVTVDLRVGVQVLVPPGVCNGLQAVDVSGCQYLYCIDTEWQAGMAGVAVTPLDPALAIPWPIAVDPSDPAQISTKDVAAPTFAELGDR